MNQCKQCGATLPENSRVCLQCGTENTRMETSAEDMPRKELDFLRPALIGGATLGILSTLPYIRAGNCVFCLWVLAGGAIATFLLNKQRPGGLKYGDGATAGVFSGLFGAIVATIVGIPVKMLQKAELEQAGQQISQSQMPPAVKEFVLQAMQPGINVTFLLIGLVIGIIIYSIFAAAGGALMVAILNRKKTD